MWVKGIIPNLGFHLQAQGFFDCSIPDGSHEVGRWEKLLRECPGMIQAAWKRIQEIPKGRAKGNLPKGKCGNQELSQAWGFTSEPRDVLAVFVPNGSHKDGRQKKLLRGMSRNDLGWERQPHGNSSQKRGRAKRNPPEGKFGMREFSLNWEVSPPSLEP